MNLRATILQEHSKANALHIVDWVGKDTDRIKELIDLVLHDEYRVAQRASYPLSIIAQAHPTLMEPYLPLLIERMNEEGVHVAVKRHVVRLLQYVHIPEAMHGLVVNTCFDFLLDPKEAIAVRAFSMTILSQLTIQYPDLRIELRAIIEDILSQQATPGLVSRGNAVLQTLEKRRPTTSP